jgi:hypothetical protein
LLQAVAGVVGFKMRVVVAVLAAFLLEQHL